MRKFLFVSIIAGLVVFLLVDSVPLCVAKEADVASRQVRVVLADGSELLGSLIGYSKGFLILKTEHGSLEIPVDKIRSIVFLDEKRAKDEIEKWKPVPYKHFRGRGVVDVPRDKSSQRKILQYMSENYRTTPLDDIDKLSFYLCNLVHYGRLLGLEKNIIQKAEARNEDSRKFENAPNIIQIRLKINLVLYYFYAKVDPKKSESIKNRITSMVSGVRRGELKQIVDEIFLITSQRLLDAGG